MVGIFFGGRVGGGVTGLGGGGADVSEFFIMNPNLK